MKLKVSEWGNSHGVRVSAAILEHLQVKAGDEIDVTLTNNGIEIHKNDKSLDYLETVKAEMAAAILKRTDAVSQVDDPYLKSEIAYIVIAIDLCAPLIREVPIGTANAYSTLADAKEAARQIIQTTIANARKSLSDLRQLGIDNISYVAL